MLLKKIITVLTVVPALIIGLQGCYKVATVYPSNTAEINEPVYFAKDIIPLFNDNCNMSGCHRAGGQKPDLTADKAFNSLNNGGYLDTITPENSNLNLWLIGKKNTPMPQGAPNNPDHINQLVLAWIKQGAHNN